VRAQAHLHRVRRLDRGSARDLQTAPEDKTEDGGSSLSPLAASREGMDVGGLPDKRPERRQLPGTDVFHGRG
jgi:hypothetical protein